MVNVLQEGHIAPLALSHQPITMKYVHATNPIPTPVANVALIVGPAVISSYPISPLAATTSASDHPTLSFFKHDIFGGSASSVRVVAGILPIPKSMESLSRNPIEASSKRVVVGIINYNFPFPSGLNGATANTVINNGNNNLIRNGKALPFVTAGQLPQGATLQKLLFGTITVIDDDLTEGRVLDSSIIGKAQGFYLASSMDGSSHTMAFTAMFHDGDHDEDHAISFFAVHRTAAIVGGTGKHENAQGYAILETLHHTNQHNTDGIDKLLQFSVYLIH
ncbi:hypothetical protein CRYUN_Cryun03dG0164500 [Craigia yunnanensis]